MQERYHHCFSCSLVAYLWYEIIFEMNGLKKSLLFSFLFTSGLAFTGCQDDDESYMFPVSMEIELRELVVDAERQPGVFLSTLRDYECLNYEISYDYTHHGDQRRLVIEGISKPTMCITSIGPATALVPLGAMQTGEHIVEFAIGNDNISTSFDLDQDLLNISVLDGVSDYLKFAETQMHRLPDDYVWGSILPKTGGEQVDFSAFFKDLWSQGAEQQEPQPGNYGFFKVLEDETVFFDGSHEFSPKNPFFCIFPYEFELIQQISIQHADHFIIVLYNTAGASFRNQDAFMKNPG